MHPIHTKTIQIDSCDIHILQGGENPKTTLLFLHGKAFQAETWKELGTLQAVLDEGFSVLALDLPGFGKSPEASLTPERVINGVMEASGCEKIILIGPSMGGKIAMEFTLNHLEMVEGLVLIGTVGIEENRNHLAQLPSATLIVWGENDQISDPENGVLLEQSIAGSKRVVFNGAKHPCYLEQPDHWHQTLLSFVKNIVQ